LGAIFLYFFDIIKLKKGFTIYSFNQYPVTNGLILINIVLFLVTLIFSSSGLDIDFTTLLNFGASNGVLVILYGEAWRLFSAMFLHGNLLHVTMNMLSLWFVGRVVEHWFSKLAYLAIYFASGVIGGLISIYFHPNTVAIGASGAIFGIFGAMGGFVLVNRNRLASFEEFIKQFGVILLLNLLIGVVFESVDLSAHIGGLIVGFVGGLMVGRSNRLLSLYIAVSALISTLLYYYLVDIFSAKVLILN